MINHHFLFKFTSHWKLPSKIIEIVSQFASIKRSAHVKPYLNSIDYCCWLCDFFRSSGTELKIATTKVDGSPFTEWFTEASNSNSYIIEVRLPKAFTGTDLSCPTRSFTRFEHPAWLHLQSVLYHIPWCPASMVHNVGRPCSHSDAHLSHWPS